ncbi:MAG: FAD-dependent oxidoreductase [Flavobacteriales bacterium]|nr:FAD-dependent oxidoreductase [Flavobacteriales bacterium]
MTRTAPHWKGLTAREPHIAVVGGGIMGAMTAAHLLEEGAMVTLYNPHVLGEGPGASVDTGRSFRVHYGDDRGAIAMAVRSMNLWKAWEQKLGRPLLHSTGKLLLEELGDRHALESWRTLRKMGLPADRLSKGAVGAEWPGMRADAATVDRLGGVLDPLVILQGLQAWLSSKGVRFRGEALDVAPRSVTDQQGKDRYDAVVLTAGAWTRRWVDVSMEVTRQELVYFDASALGNRLERLPVFSHMESGFYAIPTVRDGRIKVANHHPGVEGHPDGDDRRVSAEFEQRARAFLAQHLPELSGAEVVRRYVCFYSGTADRDFILDRTSEGVVIGAGFSGHGFKFAPLIGRLLAQLALGQSPEVDLERFSMSRAALKGERKRLAV